METEYFLRYFSSAICYDMNIIRRAAVPFQPTRKAFSTNSECISVCWNSQKMKNRCSRRHHGYQLEKTLSKLQFLVTEGDSEGSQSPGKEASGGEGQTSSLLAQLLCQVPRSHQITAQKYQVTAFGRGLQGQGELLGVPVWHLRAGGTGKRNSGQRHH